MFKKERELEIINLLKAKGGFISVTELCTLLYASESSIRRDLTSLSDKGLIRRSYGGAELITNYSDVIAFPKRAYHNREAKKIIAKKAAGLISDGNIIFLDQSSSAFYLADAIKNRSSLTVITNNIEILSLLARSNIRVISSGGALSHENRSCLIGADAQYIFRNTLADFAFFSTKSVSDKGVISDCTREEVIVRNSMLSHAEKTVFLCDSEKYETNSPYIQCHLKDIDYFVGENDSNKRFLSLAPNLIIM